jgi:hypothetical protein
LRRCPGRDTMNRLRQKRIIRLNWCTLLAPTVRPSDCSGHNHDRQQRRSRAAGAVCAVGRGTSVFGEQPQHGFVRHGRQRFTGVDHRL